MKVSRISQLDPKKNRMPAEVDIKTKPIRHTPLINPDTMVQNNPAIKKLLADFKVADPKRIRAEVAANVRNLVESVNRQIENSIQFKGIRFGLHEESGRTYALVLDERSGEVLKQIPAESMLEVAARLREASGLLVDRQG